MFFEVVAGLVNRGTRAGNEIALSLQFRDAGMNVA